MTEELEKLLKVLERLNRYVNNKIISLEIFKEEHKNVQKLNKLNKTISDILLELRNKRDDFDIHKRIDSLCSLDMNTATYTWHIEQMRNVTERFIGLYREKSYLKDINYD